VADATPTATGAGTGSDSFGATVQRMLGSPRRLRTFNVVMGLLLAASIVLIVVI